MKKVLFFILLLWCPFSIVSAQFVNFGQDRPSLRWKQIKTDDFQIIYPDFFEENAQKAASIFSLLYHHANTLQLHPKKISIIMHADGGVSNGNVALAPRKSELYTMPSQDPTDDWLEHLCVHEFRHVVQLDKVNQGLTKDLYYLFGEIFPIAVVGVYVPMWFMEGDAVCFETSVGRLGRGRSPEFLDEMKAQVLDKGIYSFPKAVLGSYKDFVPNRYVMGYFMTANARINYGSDIWAKALERTGRRPFGIAPFAKSLKLTMENHRDSLWQDSYFHSLFVDPDNRSLRLDRTIYCYNRGGKIRISTERATGFLPGEENSDDTPKVSANASSDASSRQYYYVKKGDTLSKIARQHSTTVSKLCALNGIKPTKILQIKEKLRVR